MKSPADLTLSRPLVPTATFGMVLFLASETMFFTALVSAYLVLRAEAPLWPPLDQPRLPVVQTAFNTALLLLSGWTLQRAVRGLRQGQPPIRWLDATAGLGALFLVLQGSEWVRLVGYGLTTRSSLYGASFYTLVGVHALHVLAGLVALVFVAWRARAGAYGPEDHEGVEVCRLFWLFVVGIWPVLYGLVYLA